MSRFLQNIRFLLRVRYTDHVTSFIRLFYYRIWGMKAGRQCLLESVRINWPHKVSLGCKCSIEYGCNFYFSAPWTEGASIKIGNNVFIGNNCYFNISESICIGNNSMIAAGCKFVDHDHGISKAALIGPQPSTEAGITIGADVWLGFNVIVLKGVTISDGVVVAAGSIVTKSIPAYEIWAGTPARKIGKRV